MDPLTSTKPLFSCRNLTLSSHGFLWADICDPNFLGNCHYCALLRTQSHCFPAGTVHLARMARYGPTFVVKISSYDPPYSHIRMTPHTHTSFFGNIGLGYTRAIISCISMHTCSQVSMQPGFQLSSHPFHSCSQSLLDLCNGVWVGW